MTTYSGKDLWTAVGTTWPLAPLKLLGRIGTGHTPSRSHPEYWEDCVVPWVTTEDLTARTDGGLQPLMNTRQKISEIGMANSAAVLHPPDTVMLSRTASVGHVVRIGRPMATTQAFVTWSCGPQLDPRFLTLVLNAMKPEFERIAYGSTHLTIYMPDLEQLRVPLPPIAAQRAIADYLDTETTRIDALIAKKRRLGALLATRRLAAIDNGVACDTGFVQVRHLVSRLTSGPRGWADFASGTGTPFIRITNIQRDSIELDMTDTLLVEPPRTAESRRTAVRTGDVLVSITADVGSVGVAREEQAGSNVSQHVALLSPIRAAVEPDWLAFAVRSSRARAQLDSGQYGGTKTQLSLGDVASLRVPLPPIEVQRERLRSLHATLVATDRCGGALAAQIDLLKEHRQALITAAVTGELEIPGVAA